HPELSGSRDRTIRGGLAITLLSFERDFRRSVKRITPRKTPQFAGFCFSWREVGIKSWPVDFLQSAPNRAVLIQDGHYEFRNSSVRSSRKILWRPRLHVSLVRCDLPCCPGHA